jgi:hypothetical protein
MPRYSQANRKKSDKKKVEVCGCGGQTNLLVSVSRKLRPAEKMKCSSLVARRQQEDSFSSSK